MISPWTIYKDQKESSPSPSQSKKSKHEIIKNNKKAPKNTLNMSPMSIEAQSPTKSLQNPH
jgi:hypothetical protein